MNHKIDPIAVFLIVFVVYCACFLIVELGNEKIETRRVFQYCRAHGYDSYEYYRPYGDSCTKQDNGVTEVMPIDIDHGDDNIRLLAALSIIFNGPDDLVIRKVEVGGNA